MTRLNVVTTCVLAAVIAACGPGKVEPEPQPKSCADCGGNAGPRQLVAAGDSCETDADCADSDFGNLLCDGHSSTCYDWSRCDGRLDGTRCRQDRGEGRCVSGACEVDACASVFLHGYDTARGAVDCLVLTQSGPRPGKPYDVDEPEAPPCVLGATDSAWWTESHDTVRLDGHTVPRRGEGEPLAIETGTHELDWTIFQMDVVVSPTTSSTLQLEMCGTFRYGDVTIWTPR